jgi:hypothetical protein
MTQEYHSLKRTNPKGEIFIGECVQCGAKGLAMGDAFKPCPNPSRITVEQSILGAISDVAPPIQGKHEKEGECEP